MTDKAPKKVIDDYKELTQFVWLATDGLTSYGKVSFERLYDLLDGYNLHDYGENYKYFDCNYNSLTATIIFEDDEISIDKNIEYYTKDENGNEITTPIQYRISDFDLYEEVKLGYVVEQLIKAAKVFPQYKDVDTNEFVISYYVKGDFIYKVELKSNKVGISYHDGNVFRLQKQGVGYIEVQRAILSSLSKIKVLSDL